MSKREERSAARDFVMARLGACRAALNIAASGVDEALALFVATDEDKKGETRSELVEAIDESIGDAARAIQAAQLMIDDIDPAEGEPELDASGEEDEDEGEEDEDGDEDEEE